jgi:capsular exopolysaccharide synthesis family protein
MRSILNTFEQALGGESARQPTVSPSRTAGLKPGEPLVSLLSRESFEANMYRVLTHRIEHAGGPAAGRGVIAVTSPGAGEGKTTTAINLAGTLAQSKGSRVLLVDADLRLPGVAAQMGIPRDGHPGLAELILDEHLPLDRAVRHYPPFNLSILTSGRPPAGPYEALRSPRFGALLDQARQAYDYVIVDTPPVLPVPDCRAIARWADSLLVVVAAHRTPRRYLEEALNALGPDKIVGLVFNSVDPPSPGPYAYYRGYGAPPSR